MRALLAAKILGFWIPWAIWYLPWDESTLKCCLNNEMPPYSQNVKIMWIFSHGYSPLNLRQLSCNGVLLVALLVGMIIPGVSLGQSGEQPIRQEYFVQQAADEDLDIRIKLLDVTRPDTFTDLVDTIIAEAGQIDVLSIAMSNTGNFSRFHCIAESVSSPL